MNPIVVAVTPVSAVLRGSRATAPHGPNGTPALLG